MYCPFILLGRRTSYHGELGATPSQVVYGEDVRLPGDLVPPMGSGETITDLLTRVKANADRPPAQTATHKNLPTYMPPSTAKATHVYTKKPKVTPLSGRYDGPYPIKDRIGKSCLQIQVGDTPAGQPRLETRHWKTCYPAIPDESTADAVRPVLGRKRNPII